MGKVNIEVATKEVNDWLDSKKVSDKDKELNQDQIDKLIDAVCNGYLVVNDDDTLSQTLKFPIKGEDSEIKELKYKNRVTVKEIQTQMTGTKSGDFIGMLTAYISAATVMPKAFLKNLDTQDWSLAQAIGVFFM